MFLRNLVILQWEYKMCQFDAMELCKGLYCANWTELIKSPDALNL